MAARVRPDAGRRDAALKLLRSRYGIDGVGSELAMAAQASMDVDAAGGGKPPPVEVLLAAITVMFGARAHLDRWELAFIDAARAGGVSWAEIGRAAGYAPGRDTKQGAVARRRRLAAAAEQEQERGLAGGA